MICSVEECGRYARIGGYCRAHGCWRCGARADGTLCSGCHPGNPCVIRTARISYGGIARLDVTRKAEHPFGPSWELLNEFLAIRNKAGGEITDRQWKRCATRYREEMRQLARHHPSMFGNVLAQPAVVLVCYCTNPEQCHRRLLAQILAALGGSDMGEIDPETYEKPRKQTEEKQLPVSRGAKDPGAPAEPDHEPQV